MVFISNAMTCTLINDALILLASSELLFARSAARVSSTTKAKGTSPLYSSGMPTTHTSATSGWSRRCPSSSAGATWKPLTLRISYFLGVSGLEGYHLLDMHNLQTVDDKDVTRSRKFDFIACPNPTIHKRLLCPRSFP